MANTGSIITTIGLITYIMLGLVLIGSQRIRKPLAMSISNRPRRNGYPASLSEKFKKRVISRDEYEWMVSKSQGLPLD